MATPNLRICIDGRMLGVEATGVATYARMMHAALGAVVGERLILSDAPAGVAGGDHAFSRLRRLLAALPGGVRSAELIPPSPPEDGQIVARDIFRRAQVHFSARGRLLRLDVPGPPGIMHFTYPVPLHLNGWINVYTVHDVIPLIYPQLTPIDATRHRRLLNAVAADAARLVTVSETARRTICDALDCSASFVTDCSQAVDVPPPSRIQFPPGLSPRRYLLVCGTVEPRKNIARILAAYHGSGVTMPLVIAGPDGWRAAEFAAAMRLTGSVVRIPFLPRDEMTALLANARALLMPSLAEGFGLPVIEAMALGTPVLTSDDGALRETAGGAALLVPPHDTRAIATAIAQMVMDDALCTTLVRHGRNRAADFTLSRFSARLASLYDELVADSR